jgi:S-adenosylmethionine:tRNA ribosyltransferase-isomerase
MLDNRRRAKNGGKKMIPSTSFCLHLFASMRTADFDFELPPELIAQTPAPRRDQSRLLVLRRDTGEITHRRFPDLRTFLSPGDVVVLNDSRVLPARLHGANARTGGQFEILLLEENATNDWWAMLRPGKRARAGTQIVLRSPDGQPSEVCATVLEHNEDGHRRLRFDGVGDIVHELDRLGEIPLPPYIARPDSRMETTDRERYQTVFADPAGSVAAPTAGLHFTKELLEAFQSDGVRIARLTLHVGPGTFAPVKAETLAGHQMHEERYHLGEEAVRTIQEAKAAGKRVFAVGTTSMRVLETVAARNNGGLQPGSGRTAIFIHPPYDFKVADALLTNFHLPRSTLLMLVSAFAAPNETRGREMILAAYAEAIREGYRFFSYGDAMLIL